jgi:hypothetical protein
MAVGTPIFRIWLELTEGAIKLFFSGNRIVSELP